MTRIALLRKQTQRGFSTWRFCIHPSGEFFAVNNRGERRWFRDMQQMQRAIAKWRSYGYTDFVHTEPVRRGARQLILDLAAA